MGSKNRKDPEVTAGVGRPGPQEDPSNTSVLYKPSVSDTGHSEAVSDVIENSTIGNMGKSVRAEYGEQSDMYAIFDTLVNVLRRGVSLSDAFFKFANDYYISASTGEKKYLKDFVAYFEMKLRDKSDAPDLQCILVEDMSITDEDVSALFGDHFDDHSDVYVGPTDVRGHQVVEDELPDIPESTLQDLEIGANPPPVPSESDRAESIEVGNDALRAKFKEYVIEYALTDTYEGGGEKRRKELRPVLKQLANELNSDEQVTNEIIGEILTFWEKNEVKLKNISNCIFRLRYDGKNVGSSLGDNCVKVTSVEELVAMLDCHPDLSGFLNKQPITSKQTDRLTDVLMSEVELQDMTTDDFVRFTKIDPERLRQLGQQILNGLMIMKVADGQDIRPSDCVDALADTYVVDSDCDTAEDVSVSSEGKPEVDIDDPVQILHSLLIRYAQYARDSDRNGMYSILISGKLPIDECEYIRDHIVEYFEGYCMLMFGASELFESVNSDFFNGERNINSFDDFIAYMNEIKSEECDFTGEDLESKLRDMTFGDSYDFATLKIHLKAQLPNYKTWLSRVQSAFNEFPDWKDKNSIAIGQVEIEETPDDATPVLNDDGSIGEEPINGPRSSSDGEGVQVKDSDPSTVASSVVPGVWQALTLGEKNRSLKNVFAKNVLQGWRSEREIDTLLRKFVYVYDQLEQESAEFQQEEFFATAREIIDTGGLPACHRLVSLLPCVRGNIMSIVEEIYGTERYVLDAAVLGYVKDLFNSRLRVVNSFRDFKDLIDGLNLGDVYGEFPTNEDLDNARDILDTVFDAVYPEGSMKTKDGLTVNIDWTLLAQFMVREYKELANLEDKSDVQLLMMKKYMFILKYLKKKIPRLDRVRAKLPVSSLESFLDILTDHVSSTIRNMSTELGAIDFNPSRESAEGDRAEEFFYQRISERILDDLVRIYFVDSDCEHPRLSMNSLRVLAETMYDDVVAKARRADRLSKVVFVLLDVLEDKYPERFNEEASISGALQEFDVASRDTATSGGHEVVDSEEKTSSSLDLPVVRDSQVASAMSGHSHDSDSPPATAGTAENEIKEGRLESEPSTSQVLEISQTSKKSSIIRLIRKCRTALLTALGAGVVASFSVALKDCGNQDEPLRVVAFDLEGNGGFGEGAQAEESSGSGVPVVEASSGDLADGSGQTMEVNEGSGAEVAEGSGTEVDEDVEELEYAIEDSDSSEDPVEDPEPEEDEDSEVEDESEEQQGSEDDDSDESDESEEVREGNEEESDDESPTIQRFDINLDDL